MHLFFTRKYPYGHLSEGDRDALQRALIDSAHKHMERGVVASVRFSDYESEVADDNSKDAMGSAFSMCNLWCMNALAEHIDETGARGDIAYALVII